MKALFCIPHFFEGLPEGEVRYGSQRAAKKQSKIQALSRCLNQLLLLFDAAHLGANHRLRIFELIKNECASKVDIVVLTVLEKHLLNDISTPKHLFRHLVVDIDPTHLGYAAHKQLLEASGNYDFYGYMEDDIIIHDPQFFEKITYFSDTISQTDPRGLLQPNRYESFHSEDGIHSNQVRKVYSDYIYSEEYENRATHRLDYLGKHVEFEIARAHHSGCFFVNEKQLSALASAPNFGKSNSNDSKMVLDESATLPLLQTFNIYKTTAEHMNFHQVEHAVPGLYEQMEITEDGSVIWNHPWNEND